MTRVFIQFNNITALRLALAKKFSDASVFMLLGAFDDRTDPYEILSNRPLNEDEIQFLQGCSAVVSFRQVAEDNEEAEITQ
jgi:hypothetical protein